MSLRRIVITGGPSTGKTVVIEALSKMGYHCLPEVIRDMTSAQKNSTNDIEFKTNPIVSVADPKAFNRSILNARIKQFISVENKAIELAFFDRGIPDVLAYMNCFNQSYGADFTAACTQHTYDLVFLMPPWQEIHVSDTERFESFEESIKVSECLFKAYSNLGYKIHIVPKDTIEKRVDYILERSIPNP